MGRETKRKTYHLGDTAIGEDVPGMDQTVEHLSGLFNQVTLVRVVLQLLI